MDDGKFDILSNAKMTMKKAKELRIVISPHHGIAHIKHNTVIHSVPFLSAHQPDNGPATVVTSARDRLSESTRTHRRVWGTPPPDRPGRLYQTSSSRGPASRAGLPALESCIQYWTPQVFISVSKRRGGQNLPVDESTEKHSNCTWRPHQLPERLKKR